LHPLDVAVTQRHFLNGPTAADTPGVLGVAVDDLAVQVAGRLDGVEPRHEQVGRIEVHTQPAGVELIEEAAQEVAGFGAGLQGEDGAGAVAVLPQGQERFTESLSPRIGGVLGDVSGLHDGDARAEVEGQRHDLADVFDARLLVLVFVQAVTQRTTQGRQLQVVGAEQVAELPAAGLAEGVGRQVADRVHLHAGDAEPGDLLQATAQRKTERFQPNADCQAGHGSCPESRDLLVVSPPLYRIRHGPEPQHGERLSAESPVCGTTSG
jgi:hypothetical protein